MWGLAARIALFLCIQGTSATVGASWRRRILMDFRHGQDGPLAVIMVLGISAILEGSCHAGIDSLCWRSDVFAADGQAVDVAELSSLNPTSTPEAAPEVQLAPPLPETALTRAVTGSPAPDQLGLTVQGSLLCVDPLAWSDPDIDRNKHIIDVEGICISANEIAENGLTWRVQVLDSGRPGNNWIVLHDDENTAFDAALYAIVMYGGKVVDVHLKSSIAFDRRIDPNHNFSLTDDQIRACGVAASSPAPVFTKTIVEQLGAPPYLSVHNNYDGHYRSGGHGNMSVWHSTSDLIGLPAFGAHDRLADEDNFILVSGLSPPGGITDRMHQLTDELRASGINVIYEYVQEDSYDCSLSHFLLTHGVAKPGEYFNVEAEFGDYRSQITMIDALVGTLVNSLRASR